MSFSKCSFNTCDGSGFRDPKGDRLSPGCRCFLLNTAGIPKALQGKRFENFDASRAAEQLDRVRGWAGDYQDGCRSMILFGAGKGTGKTHLMSAAAVHVALNHTTPRDSDRIIFTQAPQMLASITDAESFNSGLDRLKRVPLLFLDDVGQADEGDPAWLRAKKRDAYFRLIDYRDINDMTTVCTSNLETVDQFADVLGEAAADRLLGKCGKAGLIKFAGITSYRLRDLLA